MLRKKTKQYKKEMKKDWKRIIKRCDCKQARNDRNAYYLNKWNNMLIESETEAQLKCCHDVLKLIGEMSKQ